MAVQATVFTPDRQRMIWEVRNRNLTDWPGAITVAGGAVKPEETADLQHTMAEKLRDKYGVKELQDDQVKPSGIVFETVNGILCVTYSVVLNQNQYTVERAKYDLARSSGNARKLALIDTKPESIEEMMSNKRTMNMWDPSGFYNVHYALAAEGLRTPEQIEALLASEKALLHEKSLKGEIQYTYPMERYLKFAKTPN